MPGLSCSKFSIEERPLRCIQVSEPSTSQGFTGAGPVNIHSQISIEDIQMKENLEPVTSQSQFIENDRHSHTEGENVEVVNDLGLSCSKFSIEERPLRCIQVSEPSTSQGPAPVNIHSQISIKDIQMKENLEPVTSQSQFIENDRHSHTEGENVEVVNDLGLSCSKFSIEERPLRCIQVSEPSTSQGPAPVNIHSQISIKDIQMKENLEPVTSQSQFIENDRHSHTEGENVEVVNDLGVILHSFPNPVKDSELFRLWVLKIGGEIVGLDDNTIFKNRRVCHKHFAEHFLYLSNRLSKTAVPQFQLPAPHRLQTIINQDDTIHLPVEVQTTPALSVAPVPSTSQTSLPQNEGSKAAPHRLQTIINQDDTIRLPVEVQTKPALSVAPVPSTSQTSLPQNEGSKAVTFKICKEEQSKVKKIMKKIKLNLKNRKCTKSVEQAKNISKSRAFNILTNKMSENARKFFLMQVTQSWKKMKGRRFTLDEKILALSLYKPSPKSYRILRRMCVLPSRRSLQTLLQTIRLVPGFNERIFNHLKKRVSKMPEKHKYCTLVFDEMAIAPSCTYNAAKDIIEGFVDDGQEREKVFCDHVLVFMIRGIVKKYKQPVWFSYAAGATKTIALKKQIRKIIEKLTKAGLFVTATVCDQGTTNIAAINSLISDTRTDFIRNNKEYTGGFFMAEKKKVFVIYDPPHLMKGVRNNLLTKNLKYTMNGELKTAKWEHIRQLYERSPGYQGVTMIPKLTAHHVVPEMIPKMKVKHCTQVFSKSVGAGLGFMAEAGRLPKEVTQTADLLYFFDDLFDSVNGNYHLPIGGKIYRTAVTPRSPHYKLWRKSLPVLRSMKFETSLRGGVVPSLTSWVKTIESFKNISMFLQKKGINSLLLRNFNQDALENFFGSIRAHGHGNIMPSACHFEAAYKTLLLN